jgi:hypothetical protein
VAVRLRADGHGGEHATLGERRAIRLAVALVAVGLALIVFASSSLPAVLAGIGAILVAAFLAMRG